mgnify:CR=1 FL=1
MADGASQPTQPDRPIGLSVALLAIFCSVLWALCGAGRSFEVTSKAAAARLVAEEAVRHALLAAAALAASQPPTRRMTFGKRRAISLARRCPSRRTV